MLHERDETDVPDVPENVWKGCVFPRLATRAVHATSLSETLDMQGAKGFHFYFSAPAN